MLALFPKVLKIQHPRALKIDIFDYPTVIWPPLQGTPMNIHIKLILRETRVIVYRYIFAANNVSVFLQIFRKTHVLCNGVCNGRSWSSKLIDFSTNRRRVCNFLLVINSNLGPILPCCRDTAGYLLRTATPPPFHPNFGGVPLGLDCQCWGSEEWRP